MQGKGIVKFFLVIMTLVCLLQYLYMLPTGKVERAADAYAEQIAENASTEAEKHAAFKAARVEYLDSVSGETVFSIPLIKDYTYEELKSKQLNLGLDLKGGMSVVMQVDLREFIETLARDSKNPTFQKALDAASERQRNAQADFVSLFADEWNRISEDERLATIFMRNKDVFEGEINYESSDGEVIRVLREKANETVDLTYKRLKDRIDKFGVTQPNVSLDAGRDLILIELPGVDNPERARNYLQASAELEFWNVYRITDRGVMQNFIDADQLLMALAEGDTVATRIDSFRLDTSYQYTTDTTGTVTDTIATVDTVQIEQNPFDDKGPLLSILELNGAAGQQLGYPQAVMGVADRNKMDEVDEMLGRDRVRRLFPDDMDFRWSRDPVKNYESGEYTDKYALYAIKMERGSDDPPLDGEHITRASSQPDPTTGEVTVSLSMDQHGARIWGEMTTAAAQDNNREIAIVLDDEVVSAPRVNQPITSGDSQITGDFSIQEGQDLSNILEIGKLPASTRIIQEALVGPSLGQANIDRSFNSLLVGFLIVLLFMIVYYSGGGIVSILALFANLFFIFGALASFGTVLTLPGIAGIVLTIGMAVDANVIIYERIREELREGKTMLASIKDGFQNSYSAIIDANVTTLLVAIVLAYFGLGPIKGFAVVLIIGVISSLFTAVLFSRLVIDWWTSKGRSISFWTSISKNWFSNVNIDWLGMRRVAYIVSGVIILAGFVSIATRGFELGVDFKGGYSYNIQFEEGTEVTAQELRSSLTGVFEGEPVVKAVDTRNTYNITTDYLISDDSDDAADRVITRLHEGINQLLTGDIPLQDFRSADGSGTHVISSSKVGPTIADDIQTSSIYAAVFALLLIFLYIFIRFSKWQYSLGAVAALIHDTLIVLAVFSLLHGVVPWSMEIDQALIAALLTVIGYSINDTVVVFDRIREYLNTYVSKGKIEVINMAINSTISRTLITSLTTFFVVFVLFLFGGGSIKGFAFAILVGIFVGTYSSVFVATPIMTDMTGELKPKKASKSSSFARAKVKT